MNDLFVLTADADAQALVGTLLRRYEDLGIHQITAKVERFTGRDSGMVREGPEIARELVNKSEYRHLLLLWDHHGSGWERYTPTECESRIQQRLDGVTWLDRSGAVVLVPELEEWLWHCPASIASFVRLPSEDFDKVIDRALAKLDLSRERAHREKPKELFEAVLYQRFRRKALPDDFQRMAQAADLAAWTASASFRHFADILRMWFRHPEFTPAAPDQPRKYPPPPAPAT